MTVILTAAFAGMAAGIFFLLDLSPRDAADAVFSRMARKPGTLRDELDREAGRKKPSYLRREVSNARIVLQMTGREERFPLVCVSALSLFAAGAAAALMLGNFFLVPILAVGLMLLPFWYVRLSAAHYKRDIADELETSLSVITTAYLRTEDIITAVEENLPYLDQPVYQVFQSFLARVRYMDADLTAALTDLRGRIQNDVFAEWCDAVIACQQDRSLKSTLPAILAKLSDTRTVNAELDTMMAEPRKEFFTMVVLVVGIIPLLRFLSQDWYRILMHTPLGQFILAVCAGAIFVSTAAVIRLTQPIEYRR